MFDTNLFTDTFSLLLRGKLFRDYDFVVRQAGTGIVVAAIVLFVLVKLGFGVPISVLLVSFLSGMLQPFLFKDIKFH